MIYNDSSALQLDLMDLKCFIDNRAFMFYEMSYEIL